MAPKVVSNRNVVDLDDEDSIGSAGSVGKVVSVAKRQAASSRRSYEETPHCPHCRGRMHMNLPVSTVNFECLWRQYNLTTHVIESPEERLPAFNADDMEPFNEWIKTRSRSRKHPLTYGKMDAPDGGAATYAMAKAASKSDEDTAATTAKDAQARKANKKTAEVIPAKTPKSKPAEAAAPTPIKRPKPVAVEPPKKSSKNSSFSVAEMSIDVDDEDETPASVTKLKPRNGVRPAPASQVRSKETAKQTKPTAPAPAKSSGRRSAALAGVK